MSPWLFVVPLIIAIFLLVMAVLAVRDFFAWYRDGRDFAREQKRAKESRQQKKLAKQAMPTLKERPSEASKAPANLFKPPEQPGS